MKSDMPNDFTISSTIATPSGINALHNMGNNNNVAYVRVAACNANGCSALSPTVDTVYGTTICN
jgi:hypothetical protein